MLGKNTWNEESELAREEEHDRKLSQEKAKEKTKRGGIGITGV